MADTDVQAVTNVEESNGAAPSTKEVLDNVKNEKEDLLDQKIIRQIEYYFGDANLPNDKFIKAESVKNDGWFSLKALLTFNRIQSLLTEVPSEDRAARIVKALRASVLIDIDEKAENIRRNLEVPLPEGNSIERTVYLKGFHKTDTKLDDLIEFYSEKCPGMDGVIMRWYKEKVILPPKKKEDSQEENGKPAPIEMTNVGFVKKFKGSIFLIFKTVEFAHAFLKEENPTYAGNLLIRMSQVEYRAKKKAEFEERLASREKVAKKDGDAAEATAEVEADISDVPRGTLLKVNDLPDGFTREKIKEKLFILAKEADYPIAFIDFQIGDKNAVVRFDKGGAAIEALKLIPDSKLPVGEGVFSACELFNETDEKAYLIKIEENRLRLKRKGGAGGYRGGRGGGGRGGGRGRGRNYGKRGRR